MQPSSGGREEIIEQLIKVINNRISQDVSAKLSSKKKDEFARILSSGDNKKIVRFAISNLPRYEKVIEDQVKIWSELVRSMWDGNSFKDLRETQIAQNHLGIDTVHSVPQSLLKELELDKLPPEKQEQILTTMTELLLKRITLLLLEKLSDKQRDEYDQVLATSDPKKINNFFATNLPNYEALMIKEIEDFKEEMKKTVKKLLQ
jgi:succinate dehydrogenase flavin-adding protein (antitoxin of CptAB toxin-antitoxin module)